MNETYYEHLKVPHEGKRVIVALLPDVGSMAAVAGMNQHLRPFWMPDKDTPIIFSTREGAGANSVPHMTIAQIDLKTPGTRDRMVEVTKQLDAIALRWNHPVGLSKPIEVAFHKVKRYNGTHYAFWNADMPHAMFNQNLARLADLVLRGNALGDIRPLKAHAAPGSLEPTEDLTATQADLLRTVGYAHAGLWHITIGYVQLECNVHELIGPREATVKFGHLALGWCGPHGTIAEMIKTWPLS